MNTEKANMAGHKSSTGDRLSVIEDPGRERTLREGNTGAQQSQSVAC